MIELAPFMRDDFGRLISWVVSEEFLMQWAGPTFTYPLDEAQLERHLRTSESVVSTRKVFKAIDGSTREAVGHIELDGINPGNKSATIARVLVGEPAHRGKGMGEEMVGCVLDYGFGKLGLHRIDLKVFDSNHSAIACYEKLGFVKEGHLRDAAKVGEEYWSLHLMSILEEEWRGGRGR